METNRQFSKAGRFLILAVTAILAFFFTAASSVAQCSSTITGSPNWSALTWSSCSPNPTTSGATHSGSISLSGLSNGEVLYVDIDLTITGNLTLDANGSNPTLRVKAGKTLRINGNFVNPNNNVVFYVEAGASFIVDGVLNGGNGQVFSGTGTISGGTLNVGSASCGGACPSMGFSTCSPSGFCQLNNTCTSSVGGSIETNVSGAATTICTGTASPVLKLTGSSGTILKWQSSTNGSTWSDISNTASTYTPGNLSATTYYRAVVQNSNCIAVNSSSITISIYGSLSTTHPSNTTVCAGNNATFSVTAVAGATYSWEVKNTLNSVSTITNNSNTLTVTSPGILQNGYQYRCKVTRCGSTATSNYATLTVSLMATSVSNPFDQAICAGSNATFSVSATGMSLTYQWQRQTGSSGGFSNISGATSSSLAVNGVTSSVNGYQYRCVVTSSGSCSVTSNAATLTVNTLPSISTQPLASSVCAAANTSFSIVAAGSNLSYQWQENPGTGVFSNVALANSATLNLLLVTSSMNGYQYRCVVTGSCTPSVTSNSVALTVNSTVTWTGNFDDNWHNAANWSCGVPSSFTDVIIPGALAVNPVIYAGAVCNNLFISFKGKVSVSGSNSFTVLGNIINEGDFEPNTSSVILAGVTDQTIGGTVETEFYDLQVVKVTGDVELDQNILIENSVVLTLGLINTNNYQATFSSSANSPIESTLSRIVGTAEMALRNINFGAVNFLGVTMASSLTDDVGDVTIVRYSGTKGKRNVGAGGSIASTWHIEVSKQPSINGRDVTFTWIKDFDNIPLDLTTLEIWKAPSASPGNWARLEVPVTASLTDLRTTSAVNTKSFSHWTVTELSSPLPVSIQNLKAFKNEQTANLQWQTLATAEGYFSVEKSNDNINFIEIERIEAVKGIMINYNVSDEAPGSGSNYYRIKFSSLNSIISYSSVVSLEFESKSKFSSYPNPFSNSFTVEIELKTTGNVTASLYNITGGEEVAVKSTESIEGSNSITFSNLSNLKAGVYIVKVVSDKELKQFKMIKK